MRTHSVLPEFYSEIKSYLKLSLALLHSSLRILSLICRKWTLFIPYLSMPKAVSNFSLASRLPFYFRALQS